MDQNVVLLTILGMGLVTYLPRLLPLLILTRPRKAVDAPRRAVNAPRKAARGETGSTMPPLLEAWLRHVPAAVMAAMLFPSLFIVEGRFYLTPENLYLWAAVPTLWIAWKTRSLFGAVLAGMAVVAMGRLVLG